MNLELDDIEAWPRIAIENLPVAIDLGFARLRFYKIVTASLTQLTDEGTERRFAIDLCNNYIQNYPSQITENMYPA